MWARGAALAAMASRRKDREANTSYSTNPDFEETT
jgi:hypothetical protein